MIKQFDINAWCVYKYIGVWNCSLFEVMRYLEIVYLLLFGIRSVYSLCNVFCVALINPIGEYVQSADFGKSLQ